MKILLSNDDGVYALGIRAMYDRLKNLGEVYVVAPLEEKSTTGHSLTLHKPLRLIPIKPHFFGVSGSPADCVYLGIKEVMKTMPDLVVSGINRGANLGQDVYYSGTVSAAREACILGIPSVAVSLAIHFDTFRSETEAHYKTAAATVVKIIRDLDLKSLPKYTLLNVNVPDLPAEDLQGIRVAQQGFRFYSGEMLRRKDHRGKDYYWIGADYKGFRKEAGTDCSLVDAGFVSLTPIKLDSTDVGCFSLLNDLKCVKKRTRKK